MTRRHDESKSLTALIIKAAKRRRGSTPRVSRAHARMYLLMAILPATMPAIRGVLDEAMPTPSWPFLLRNTTSI